MKNKYDAVFRSYAGEFVALQTLFELLARNEMPDFLVVMDAINEIVAFNAKDDSLVVDDVVDNLKMSLNKCRFCA